MPRTTVIRLLFAVLAVGFFAAPIAARMAGVNAESFENRRFADAPKLSQGWDAFQQTTRYLTDRMPLRAQAVRANTRIWTDVFGTDPRYGETSGLANDQAIPFAGAIERAGRDQEPGGAAGERDDAAAIDALGTSGSVTGRGGWLYVPEEFSFACDDTVRNEVALRRWGGLVQTVRRAGHESVLLVTPYKASVYPEHLPDEYPFDHCALEEKERFWSLLSRDGPGLGLLELRSELLRRKAYAGDGLFQRKDSHWTTRGALVLVDTVLDAIGDGVRLKPDEIVRRGSVSYTGDLSVAGGRSETDERAEYGIVRAPGAPRVPGRTLLVCDSFTYKWMRLLKPYFADVRYVSWFDSDGKIAAAIRGADTVVFETTELVFEVQAGDGEDAVSVARELAGRR